MTVKILIHNSLNLFKNSYLVPSFLNLRIVETEKHNIHSLTKINFLNSIYSAFLLLSFSTSNNQFLKKTINLLKQSNITKNNQKDTHE